MNDRKWISPVTIEGAQFHYKDFAGKKYGNGQRNVGIRLSKELADELAAEGWNVKVLEATEEYPEEKYYINVKINYGVDRKGNYRHPDIYMIAGDNMTLLDENSVNELDRAEIINCDLTFSPNFYEDHVTAYLSKMYVTIQQELLDQKYAKYNRVNNIDIPEDDPYDM